MNRATKLILSLCWLLSAAPAQADIYALEDGEGTLHLTDTPVGEGYELLLESRPAGAPASVVRTVGRSAAAAAHQQRIARVADRTGVEAGLLNAVIAVESAYNPKAVSPKGAAGLMQLMPDTARRYGVTDRFDPDQNLLGGALYLRDLMARFDNQLELALAAYNAGEGAVERHGRKVPPFAETLRYVPKVLDHYRSMR
ncbi:lytic transglycosylase domain-containing protein [Methyloversatilis sp. XJ19-49]|uniref:lytic transglycosylase domain-containing protein n=1 Tax=Methyloversatilis sp. XJ19-49 TaxID=2963429 RepID=UPI00211CBEF7|nr:lytic transglycosylase domain-containing protein [Methyloversatilis sp. XJ19-49]MCQ9379968.1 lytic transglycosylase domain-containing protein [Methyloversatilis sp. XJ19-49]